ncbi:hypothetical protein CEXT_797541 [Caerostris extrusa]|uniref:Uncharacterized protein n=1 Tax=Caerostris extrusa TaxID=172846 RepID=A0AAV4UPY7_CAEEX|nr:hypothetical protein CEXT_797541 [Caerostris extrusa]
MSWQIRKSDLTLLFILRLKQVDSSESRLASPSHWQTQANHHGHWPLSRGQASRLRLCGDPVGFANPTLSKDGEREDDDFSEFSRGKEFLLFFVFFLIGRV